MNEEYITLAKLGGTVNIGGTFKTAFPILARLKEQRILDFCNTEGESTHIKHLYIKSNYQFTLTVDDHAYPLAIGSEIMLHFDK